MASIDPRIHPIAAGAVIGTIALVACLFFGIFIAGDRFGPISAFALYPIPAVLVFALNRRWTIATSPIAYLLSVVLWQATYATHSPSYDSGWVGWAIRTFATTLIVMPASGALGLWVRRSIDRRLHRD